MTDHSAGSSANSFYSDHLRESSNLDLLRTVAVLLVVMDHVLETYGALRQTSFHPYDWYMGRAGVLMFFVHTSLVLMLSMKRMNLDGKTMILSFYTKRFFRIYPLSVFAVSVVLIFGIPAVAWDPDVVQLTVGGMVSNYLLTQNLTYTKCVLSPLWSLPLEVQMYLVLPLLYIGIQRISNYWFVVFLWCASVLVALAQPHIMGRLNVAQFGPCFVAGVIAFYVASRGSEKRLSPVLWVVWLFSSLGLYFYLETRDAEMHKAWVGWVFCLQLGGAVMFFQDIQNKWLKKMFHLIARYSYGIYLFHMIALWIAFFVVDDVSYAVQWGIFLFILAASSIGSYHVLEQPLIQYGNRLAARLRRTGSVIVEGKLDSAP